MDFVSPRIAFRIGMDFRLVRRLGHFLAVAEEGHFGRAAARLGISQPPLTAQIQALERELGVQLLERTGKGARPTREGRGAAAARARSRAMPRELEALARELRAGRNAPVSIACVTSALFDYLPPLVRAMQAARPDAAIGCGRWTRPTRWRRCGAARWTSPAALDRDRGAGPPAPARRGRAGRRAAVEGHPLLEGPDAAAAGCWRTRRC
jgi:DNA-binding transcriptional LysR family regulator